jgi:hypothetical protein
MSFSFSPKIVTDGLVLYLDAANSRSYVSGSTIWTDISRVGNNGLLINGPTFSSSNGGSIVFATDDYISSFSTQISDSNSKTVIVWFNTTTTSRAGLCGTTSSVGTNGWSFLINRTAAGNLTYFHNGGSILQVSAGIVVNTWYQGCIIYNSATAVGTLYLNGTQIGSPLTSFSVMGNSAYNGIVGNEDQLLTSPFNGRISNVQIYNRALTPSEVLQNFNSTKSRFNL